MYVDQYFVSLILLFIEFKFVLLFEDWYKFYVIDVSVFFIMKVKWDLIFMIVI